jgi:hypothetical protein
MRVRLDLLVYKVGIQIGHMPIWMPTNLYLAFIFKGKMIGEANKSESELNRPYVRRQYENQILCVCISDPADR